MLARHAESPDFLESPALQAEAEVLARDLADDGSHFPHGYSASGSKLSSPRSSPSMRPPWWMVFLVAVFVADCLLRSYCLFLGPKGFDFRFRWEGDRPVVSAVPPGSIADRAGIKSGDILLSLDGRPVRRGNWAWITPNLERGRTYLFDIEREGKQRQARYLMARVNVLVNRDFTLWQIIGILLLATALLIAFGRPYYFPARMGALALATLSISLIRWGSLGPPGYAAIWRDLPLVVGALLWIPTVCSYLVGPILLTFFALFPRALFRVRWPWVVIWLPALCFVPVFFHSNFLMVYYPLQAYGNLVPSKLLVFGGRLYGLFCLASLGALTANYFRLADPNDRRRLRVLFIGGAAAVLPGIFRLLIWNSASLPAIWKWVSSGTPDLLLTLIFVLFPVCFAYSILRHWLLDIRIIIRQGVRYLAARGALLSVVPVLGAVLVVDLLVHGDQPLIDILELRGWVYAALGVAAVTAHWQRRRWGDAIDRLFFRERYDARRLLLEVAGHARQAGSFEHAAPGIVARIEKALHPEFAAIMLRPPGNTSFQTLASAPSGQAPPALMADSKLIAFLRILARPLEAGVDQSNWLERQLPPREVDFLRQSRIEILIPVAMTPEQNEALLVLGAKRSEEPYTGEDLDLLAAIATRLALLLAIPAVPPARISESFDECPECGTCYDTGTERCAHDRIHLTPVLMPRSLVGRYRLERRRGRGGMGTVYEATDRALERRVAIKVVREDWVDNAIAAQRFQREARTAAGFDHPNVVTVHDYGVEAGTWAFLVMELLEGSTLREEIRRLKRLDPARTVEVFQGVCSAVHAAHSRRMIHRDLKPENIFLTRSGDNGNETVKVLDFGIAKLLAADDAPAATRSGTETGAGILVGTLGYISPEQLLGERPAVSWDLWALAVAIYETLTGALPFPVENREIWRQSVTAGRYTPLSAHLKNPAPRLQEFFARSLAMDRTRRPQSAADFSRQMEQALT
ncbi:MAG: protein kinase [Acidobacteriia bacterium]|nr:protein kinase [Terriglobia bacterium]